MVFWRKKNKSKQAEQEARDDALLHPKGEPGLELPTEHEAEIGPDLRHELDETTAEIIADIDEAPVPDHTPNGDAKEAEELDADHSEEGGWLSRLTAGLSKSTNRFTKGLADLVTKRKLDEETLEQLEDMLIEADLGPSTAAKIIADFSKDRFGKEIEAEEIKQALADSMSEILKPVASHLEIKKPEGGGPFVILVCGVNGAGKTTTIGKMAYKYHFEDRLSVMIAAGDTFRAAAVEQLQIWAQRASATFLSKDIGADAAAVAFEAYVQAKAQGADVLLIDTAGRLQNKKNLMAELEKIIRVLKKQDENLPHATLLVLDATTGQNAFSQVETFKEMVNISGLIVTKLDGSAKGGVLVGLADQFGVPVYKIGVGEGIKDMQPFNPEQYARALVGLET